jgi:hypothetical protein
MLTRLDASGLRFTVTWVLSDENVLRLHVDCDFKFTIRKLFSNGKDRAI